MKKFFFGMTVDDVALADGCERDNLCRLMDFFAARNLPATFFVVPLDEESGRPLDEMPGDYVSLIQSAQAAGHEFAQHGLSHNRFELGVPPDMVLDLPHEAENKRYARENAAELAEEHSLENCRRKLRQGREILERVLGAPPRGFRSPALQESPGMFAALAAEGYLYDSSNCLQETGWDYIVGNMQSQPREINRAGWQKLRDKAHGLMLPLTCDYTWFLSADKYQAAVELARHDLRQCMKAEIPFVPLCHVNPVFAGEGMRLLEELFDMAQEECTRQGRQLQFATMTDIAFETI